MSSPEKLSRVEKIGDFLVDGFHLLGLFVIGALTFWSAMMEVVAIMKVGEATLKDILLLFIYLEIGAMIGIYFKTNHLPVRYLIYIAITALTRVMVVDIKIMSDERVLALTGAIVALSVAILVLRFASARYPAPKRDRDNLK